MTPSKPILEMRGISKHFGGTIALAHVDFSLQPGEVHSLVGENGAGKSTLIKIMTGAYRRTSGEMLLDGSPVDFEGPAEAQSAGVVAVYQEVHLLEYRTVAENLLLGREPRRFGFLDWRRMNAAAQAILDRLGLAIDATATVGELDIALRQMIAIARGVSLGAKVLVLDEPTSSLTEREVSLLYGVIRRVRAEGTAIVYISHRFDELYAICDRVTVLRDGRNVMTQPLGELERIDLICAMLGKDREELRGGKTAFAGRSASRVTQPLLEANHLRRSPGVRDASLRVDAGEIVGMAGLLGSGRTEVARMLYGADTPDAGSISLGGRRLALRSPKDGIAAQIAMLSEDRKAEGIIPELSVRENLTLAALPTLSRAGIVSKARQRAVVERYMKRLRIKASSMEQPIRELSGGNQQKVLLARLLCKNPKLLLLDEPTRGVDVGAKGEIQSLIQEMAEDGLGVLLISSELDELVEGSSRVVVMREGRSVAELSGSQLREEAIIAAMAEADVVDPALEGREANSQRDGARPQ